MVTVSLGDSPFSDTSRDGVRSTRGGAAVEPD